MSAFICLMAPGAGDGLARHFEEPIELREASDSPIGRSVLGGRRGDRAYLALVNGLSTDILGHGARRDDRGQEFLRGLSAACDAFPSVSLVLHVYRGEVATEEVVIRERRKLGIGEFCEIFPDLGEDVRYTLVRGS